MAWIESHQELERHPKTFELMSQMSWDLDTCLGKLHRFWWWCVDYAQDGDLRKHNDSRIAIAMGVAMQDSKRLVEAMVTAGWLDREPYFRVHDWWDYIGLFLQRRYADKPNSWKNIQQMYSNLTVNCQESVMSLAQPNQTKPNQTKPKKTIAATKIKINFDFSSSKFLNLEDKLGIFREKFPAVSIDAEILKMEAWLMAHPKNRKSNYEKFIAGWLSRCQDRAPTMRHEETVADRHRRETEETKRRLGL